MPTYLVGGVVRDLLLRRPIRDLDLVVEGDACQIARTVGEILGADVRVHESFRTATLTLPGGLSLDLAAARCEHYRAPGALPDIEPGDLQQDLSRRDFTVNAMAVDLSEPRSGELIDPFGGRRDLDARKIRILHERSFLDDPTRAFRAIRLATRLGFEIDGDTDRLIRAARREGAFDALSPQRLRRELELALDARELAKTVAMLSSFELLSTLHPKLEPTPPTAERLQRAEDTLAWYRSLGRAGRVRGWVVALGVLSADLDDAARSELLVRLRPDRAAERVLNAAHGPVRRLMSSLDREAGAPSSRIHELCRDQPAEVLLVAMAVTGRERAAHAVKDYLSRLADARLQISGSDLIAAGVPEGPGVAVGLQAALTAKLDGHAPDRERQLRRALSAALPP